MNAPVKGRAVDAVSEALHIITSVTLVHTCAREDVEAVRALKATVTAVVASSAARDDLVTLLDDLFGGALLVLLLYFDKGISLSSNDALNKLFLLRARNIGIEANLLVGAPRGRSDIVARLAAVNQL